MLVQLCPRVHTRYSALRLLGRHVEAFVVWLDAQGCPHLHICRRLRALPRLDERLQRCGVRRIEDICLAELLRFAPPRSQDDTQLSGVVRSLARYLNEAGLLARRPATSTEETVSAYRLYLERVRGLARKTLRLHSSTAAALLRFIDFDRDSLRLRKLDAAELEEFVKVSATRLSRESLQHTVAYLRSFLRYLGSQDLVARGLDASIDTPRLFRGERLPRALPWERVQSFLDAIDRSTPTGRRDHAMFLLMATYGLRAGEVAALRLDDIDWRAARIRLSRPKTGTPLELPLTGEVGDALVEYLRDARPERSRREVFIRLRAPAGPIGSTAVSEAFWRIWKRLGEPAPRRGPHCLRHSLAVHLLRQGTSLKAIGDLLGHRSPESTCVYLRLQVDDLRGAALSLPPEVCA